MKKEKGSTKGFGMAAGVLVVFAVVAVVILNNKQTPATPIVPTDTNTNSIPSETTNQQPTPTPVTNPVTSTTTDTTKTVKTITSAFKDGTYSATGSYMSPGGEDQLGVQVTLANDIITDVSVTPLAGDHTSARYQTRFISGYKQYVIGKKITDIHLTRVSGSSLTPAGFNDALSQIESQARA